MELETEETPNSPKSPGLISILISFIFTVASIVMSSIDFQVLNVRWNNSPWRHLGICQLTSSIYSGFTCIIGMLVFSSLYHQKPLIGFVRILNINYIVYASVNFINFIFFSDWNFLFIRRNNLS